MAALIATVYTPAQAAAAPAVPAGTPAPDGIGVAVGQTSGVGQLAHAPWVDESVIRPLPVGARMPPGCVVRTVDDRSFDLNAAAASKPTVLIFYRGGWCPYCNAHLRQLQSSAPALQSLGYQLLAISSDTPAELRETMTQDELSYQLLSDVTIAVAAKFGLRYKATDEFLAYLKQSHGTDLAARNGGYLLTPAAFILDRAGVIRFVYANDNFTVRVSQAALLKAARAALATPAR